MLVDHKADPTFEDEVGKTCLEIAQGDECKQEIRRAILILHGWTDMMILAREGAEVHFQRLLAYNWSNDGSINAVDSNGRTALHHALDRDDPEEFARFREARGQQEPSRARSRLGIAASLIQARADVGVSDRFHATALHHACAWPRPTQQHTPPPGSDLDDDKEVD